MTPYSVEGRGFFYFRPSRLGYGLGRIKVGLIDLTEFLTYTMLGRCVKKFCYYTRSCTLSS